MTTHIASTRVGPVPDRVRGGSASAGRKPAWPKTLPEQVRELRVALAAASEPVTADYKIGMLKKQQLYQQQGKKLISLYPEDKPCIKQVIMNKLERFR